MINLRLCQLKSTGEIYYYLGEVHSSKGLVSLYEVPSNNKVSEPDIRRMYKLNFSVSFILLPYGVNNL